MRKALYLITALLLTAVLIRIFLLDTFIVSGDSMAPTIVGGDYVFVNKIAYLFDSPQRNDIVVGNFRGMDGIKAIKRVVGLPREWVRIENGEISVAEDRESDSLFIRDLDSEEFSREEGGSEPYAYRLDPHEYFLVGDNGLSSVDSRELGPIDTYSIDGKVFMVFRLGEFKFLTF